MGGAGKTPMVDYLAERLQTRGHRPAILTRGYRRRSIESSILIEAGEPVPVSVTGDEAQIYVHSGYAQTGIGADRWSTGRLLEAKYRPGPVPAGRRIPAPRSWRATWTSCCWMRWIRWRAARSFRSANLREPLNALARAGAFVIMRTVVERDYAGLVNLLRAHNPRAPIFRARTEPRYWVSHRTERLAHPPEGPVAAFCGLGESGQLLGNSEGAANRPGIHVVVR